MRVCVVAAHRQSCLPRCVTWSGAQKGPVASLNSEEFSQVLFHFHFVLSPTNYVASPADWESMLSLRS